MPRAKKMMNEVKAPLELTIITALLVISFMTFALLAAVNPELLNINTAMATELVLCIPFLAAAAFMKVKVVGMPESRLLDKFSHVTFTVGYALLINSVGIMLFYLTTTFTSAFFFLMNITIALAYSAALVTDHRETFRDRMGRDLLFIILVLVLGILMLPR